MATVTIQKRQRKDRMSYIVYYKHPMTHEHKYHKTFKRLKTAQREAHELRSLIDTGKLPEVEHKKEKLRVVSFREMADMQKTVWDKKLQRKEIRQKTHDGYMDRLNVVNQVFGKQLLCKIKEQEVMDYRDLVVEEQSVVTANRNLFVIKQIFKRGMRKKAIHHDPSAKVKYLSERDSERKEYLLPESIDRLIKESQKVRAKFYLPAMIYLGAEHGASTQEILDLEWSHIKFEYEGIGTIRLFRTKNKKLRTEYLMPRTRKALLEWQKHQKWMRHRRKIKKVKSDFVFCRLDGTPFKGFNKAWNATKKIAGVNGFHFHDLRHTFCSNLLLSGSDIKDVKEMIGHRDLAMTDRYSHLTLEHKRSCQERLAQHYTNGE